ncbi:MAG: hypothetical protein ABSA90_12485 [Xanthobacteraceae bacterium]|jgi:hypothetical protein
MKGESIRYAIPPRDVPPVKAARRLHLTLCEFEAKKEELFRRGFPRPDLTTGMYDLVKIDKWIDDRDKPSTTSEGPRDAREVLAGRFSRGVSDG